MMMKRIAPFAFALLVFCNAGAQTTENADTTCILSLTENRAFTAYANTRIKASINALNNSAQNEILYLIYSKPTNTYKGFSLVLDENHQVSIAYRFAYNKASGMNLNIENWPKDSLDLKTLFIDSACYMNERYKVEGTDEMLLRRRKGQPINGLIYKGCSGDPKTENSVYNKTLLQLLIRCRSRF